MSAAVGRFIEEIALHFPRREASEQDEKAWARSMARNLGGFSAEVLERAAQIIIDTSGYTGGMKDFHWLPKECKEACIKAQKALGHEKPDLKFHGPKADANYSDRETLAYELIAGPLGRRAAKEGWVHSLYTFTRDHMRLPTNTSEINWCIDCSRGFDREFQKCRDAPAGSIQSRLIELGLSMLNKRHALEKYVETGELP